ncbi:MAG: GAF domain-containing protein [Hyphomicrobiales bacterium]
MLTSLLQTTAETLQATESSVFRPDDNENLYFFSSTNQEILDNPEIKPIPIGGSIAGFVFMTGQTIAREDAAESEDQYGEVDRAMKYKTREYMAAPIVSGDAVLGVLTVVNRRKGTGLGKFSEDEIHLAEELGRTCGVVLDHVQRLERQTDATRAALRGADDEDGERTAIRARIDATLGDLSERDLDLIHELTERLGGASEHD